MNNRKNELPIPEDTMDFYLETQCRSTSFYMPYEHSHKVIEFYYLRRGQCLYIVNGAFVHLHAGDIMIVAPGDRHNTSYSGDEISERVAVFINREALPDLLFEKKNDLEKLIGYSHKINLAPSMLPSLENILFRINDEQISSGKSSELMLCLYISELLVLIADSGTTAGDVFIPMKNMESNIQKAIHIIDTKYTASLLLQDVAKQIKLNSSYFSHRFKVVTGYTFKEYVNNVRLRNAVSQLLITDDSITTIALNCGFSSSNYFKDIFRKKMGCSPREYRKRASVSAKHGSGIAE